jgi:nucleotide-binding universal stress UspA family protein
VFAIESDVASGQKKRRRRPFARSGRRPLKVLLAIDGSRYSEDAVTAVASSQWPPGTEIRIVTIVHSWLPMMMEPTFVLVAAHEQLLIESRQVAPSIVERAASKIRTAHPELPVTTRVLEGSPKNLIVDEAETWEADLIVMGAHGMGAVKTFFLGSVSQAVTLRAPCSVLIVRGRHHSETRAA